MTQQCVDSGKTPCYINLDETSVARCAAKAVGYIAPPRFWPGRLAPRRPLQKQQKRAAITHIALIASMPEVQPKLPQIFVCNERVVPAWALASPELEKPETVHFWRGKSGWNNVLKMLHVLVKLSEALVDNPNLQPILLLDCVGCHIHAKVAAKAEELGIWIVVVPARLTFLLQPLDVYAFSAYKAFLTKLFLEAQGAQGNFEVIPWMRSLCRAVREFWNARKWLPAFQKTGIVRGTEFLTEELEHLGVSRLLPGPVLEPPTWEAITDTFPRGRCVPYVSLFWQPAKLDPPILT